ncbi:hypothetical protein [Bordetella petrii]|uniref:hypothetical protein n=1 Tax=Bordetella petrii TaxID=94624 RepID=UPI001E657987|nr:hypothetical protein [Bordetella petrii]MCD0504880.1 hypothetical protein [Bordetella petrii]
MTTAKATAKPAQARARKRGDTVHAKVLPPRHAVDVPRQPPKPTADTPDEAAKDSRPARDSRDDSNWADGSKPRPHAKNTRSHLL